MSINLSSKKADLAHIEDAMQTMELGSREEERAGLTEAGTALKADKVGKDETRINISPKLEPCFPLTNTSNLYFGPKVIPAPDRTQEEKDQYEAGVPLPRNEESTVSILDSKFFINTDTIKIKRTSEFNEAKPFEGIKLSLSYNSLISCKWKLFWGYTEEEFRKQMYPLGEKLDTCEEGHIQRKYLEVDGEPGINKDFTIDNLGKYLEGLFRKDGEFLIRPPEPIADGLRSSFERKLVETWTRSNNDDSGNSRRRSNLRLTVAIPKPDRAPPPPRVWFPLIIHLTSNELCEGDKAKLNKTNNSITIYIDITTEESRRIDDLPGGREKTEYNPNEDIEAKNLIFEVQHLKTKVTINGNNFVVNPIFGYDTLMEKTLESNAEVSTDSNFIPIKKDETNAGLTECVICLEAKCNTAILPCRHLCLCYDCSIELNTQTRRCPICRQDVDALLHIDIHQAAGIGAFSNVKAQVCK